MNYLACLVYDHHHFMYVDVEQFHFDDPDFLKWIQRLFQNTSEKIEAILLDSPLKDWA